jgi:hypothetical protein
MCACLPPLQPLWRTCVQLSLGLACAGQRAQEVEAAWSLGDALEVMGDLLKTPIQKR